MPNMTYAEQLNDPRWKRKREKILTHADHRCQTCGVENESLQVHHSYYRNGLMAWEYPDGSLVALCDDCHGRIIHGIRNGKETFQNDSGWWLEKTHSLLQSICFASYMVESLKKEGRLQESEEHLECSSTVQGSICYATLLFTASLAACRGIETVKFHTSLSDLLETFPEHGSWIIDEFEAAFLNGNEEGKIDSLKGILDQSPK